MPRCRVLLTGFEPFARWPRNPSADVARILGSEGALARRGLVTAILPVHRMRAPRTLAALLRAHRPEAVVLTGLAAGRKEVALERLAVNCWRRIGDRGAGRRIVEGGPDGLFTTLPLDAGVRALATARIPVTISESAGTYCCNLVLYRALLWSAEGDPATGLSRRCGFVHLPATAESLPSGRCEPCLPLEALVAGVGALCSSLLGPRRRSPSTLRPAPRTE